MESEWQGLGLRPAGVLESSKKGDKKESRSLSSFREKKQGLHWWASDAAKGIYTLCRYWGGCYCSLIDYFLLSFHFREAFRAPFLDKHWHHACVTWTNNGGEFKFYIDGSLMRVVTGYGNGDVIRGGGILIFGQEQDNLGGSFDAQQSLVGFLSHLNLWNFVVHSFALVDIATGSGTENGNTVAWKDVIRCQAYGQVEVVSISQDPPKREYYWLFGSKPAIILSLLMPQDAGSYALGRFQTSRLEGSWGLALIMRAPRTILFFSSSAFAHVRSLLIGDRWQVVSFLVPDLLQTFRWFV